MSTENQLPTAVETLAAEFEKHITHGSEGVFDGEQKGINDAIEAVLPEGMTFKMAKEFKSNTERNTLAALALATSNIGFNVFEKDKDIKSVSFATKFFGDKMAVSMDREREITIPGRNGAPVTKDIRQNYIVAKHKTQATSPSGALAKVKQRAANWNKK
jgi:hypothetical protein